ncbi:TetR/AcrR family transcriptional repressor of lfrA [Rhodococcus sp. 27YEA15]|uniref:TetR/AcrR family transcriptional regulator n=1 Tax=Rhodococcus sp. 27YEA15 TaxID=3156259 RepID=UPI003C7C6654
MTTIHRVLQQRSPEPSATRERTRKAILGAAVSVLARQPAATLADIAAAAKVGRTTLHRYFPERSDLVAAVSTEAAHAVRRAATAARLNQGTGAEALTRLCHEYFELADLLTVLFFTPGVYQEDSFAEAAADYRAVNDAIERGHLDGTVDPAMSSDWVHNLLWSLMYTSIDYVNRGAGTRLQALELTLRSLRRSITPDPMP